MSGTYVIMCNDSVEAVVFGTEQFVRDQVEILRLAHAQKYCLSDERMRTAYWRHRSVPVIKQGQSDL